MLGESRSTISAVCWVPRGKSSASPASYLLAEQDLSKLQSRVLSTNDQKKKKKKKKSAHSSLSSPHFPTERRDSGKAEDTSGSDEEDWSDEEEEEDQRAGGGGEEEDVDMAGEEEEDADGEDGDNLSGTQFFGVLKEDGACTLHDPFLKGGEEDSEEEEANVILPTDLVLVAATAEQDFSSLEIYVYDEDRGSFYVHHDILTGGFPLCLEWISTAPSGASSSSTSCGGEGGGGSRNLVASGSFDPEISIWDLDVLDRVDAVCTLGKKKKQTKTRGKRQNAKKRKKKSLSSSSSETNDMAVAEEEGGGGGGGEQGGGGGRAGEEEEGHEGPVMCLHASPVKPSAGSLSLLWKMMMVFLTNASKEVAKTLPSLRQLLPFPVAASTASPRQILASGSADDTVKLWDLTTARCLYTYRHHTNKVQSLRWHPVEEAVLLSASFDRRASVIDVRTSGKSAMHAPLRADAEVCVWDRHHPMNFWVSSEDGYICGMDVRKMSSASSSSSSSSSSCVLWTVKGHEGAASGLCEGGISDLMVTCGVDGKAKLWSVSGRTAGSECFSTSASSSSRCPSLVFERDLKGGPLYCCQTNMDLPNVIGFGGNCVVLWDITDTDLVKTTFGLKS